MKAITLEVTENGCSSSSVQHVEVTPQTQGLPICMVTVDEAGRNLILWEQLYEHPYQTVLIYKEESQAGIYQLIGEQAASQGNSFQDPQSDPARNATRYKLAFVDTCGYTTEMSPHHKTLHLTINAGINGAWNLIWDRYEGFEYSTFHILRGTADGSLIQIAELPSNTFTFTDANPPEGTVRYQIEIRHPYSCYMNTEKSAQQAYSATRSNIVNSRSTSIGNHVESNELKVWPNPASNILNIHSDRGDQEISITLLTLNGEILKAMKAASTPAQLDLRDVPPGVYLVRMETGQKVIYRRVIKM